MVRARVARCVAAWRAVTSRSDAATSDCLLGGWAVVRGGALLPRGCLWGAVIEAVSYY